MFSKALWTQHRKIKLIMILFIKFFKKNEIDHLQTS